jgi:hypothetical protein
LREETQKSRDESPQKADKVLATNSDDDTISMISNPIDNVLNSGTDPRSLKTMVAPSKDKTDGQKQVTEPAAVYRLDAPSTHRKKTEMARVN